MNQTSGRRASGDESRGASTTSLGYDLGGQQTAETSAVSVVLATYEGSRFIVEQVESLLAQSIRPAELIVADDGSSDGTLDLVRAAVSGSAIPVRIVENGERKGFRRNFLDAAALATAPLVAFCDQDDVWHPEKLATMVQAFAVPDVLLAYHNADLIDPEGHRIGRLYGADGDKKRSESLQSDPWSYSLGFTQVFRQELLAYARLQSLGRDFLFADTELAHDQWFYFLATCLGRVAFVDRPLVSYRQHATNVFGAVDRDRARHLHVIKATLDHSPVQLEARATSLRSRAQILRRIEADDDESSARREAAHSHAVHYEDLARLYERRLGAYGPVGIGKAIRWARLVLGRRDLMRRGLSYPARHGVRDLAFGVLLGHLASPIHTR